MTYLKGLGNKLHNPKTSQKSYWKIINSVMNNSRTPKIPPILKDNTFVVKCCEKAKLFNDFFSKQCTLNINDSILPPFECLTTEKMDSVQINGDAILSLIRSLNPNKVTGSDGITAKMLLLCDESVVLPLKII